MLDITGLLIISAVVLLVDVVLLYLKQATIRREEIPAKWK
jgi:hypothetical protein